MPRLNWLYQLAYPMDRTMPTEIGAFEAKTHLSRLLREVEGGRSYTITVRGRPVADLVPSGGMAEEERRTAVEGMRQVPKVRGVADADVAAWISEGRR